LRVRSLDHRAEPLEEFGRDLVATTLGAEHLLELALEVGVTRARIARPKVLLDLDALNPHELTIEVQLDLSQHVLAVSR
jgi:hypothetical protein